MNVSVIIPVHEYNDEIASYLLTAVESIEVQEKIDVLPEILIVYAPSIEKDINDFRELMKNKYKDKLKFNFIKNEGNTDYQSQINLAVKSVTTDYFSVLEFDDEYSTTYLNNVNKYIEAYPEVDVFLTMIIETNEKNEGMKITNELVWAQQFVGENGEMGYLNTDSLKQYSDFKLSGAVIKKSEFENLGGYKSNIKLTFMYEFLLRALGNAFKIFTIPKIGYKHLVGRKNSLFDVFKNKMSMEERKFWFDTAVKESNFPMDRPIDMSSLTKK